jgi:hypothetical protein
MGLFKRKKKNKAVVLEEALESRPSPPSQLDGKQLAERQAYEYCEQIMDSARELEDTKKEYRMVTSYLSDIQVLEELPENDWSKIEETAKNIEKLKRSRDVFANRDKRISDAQFVQMEQLESDIPGNIKRLQKNEQYQSLVKRDMDFLEGEKGSQIYTKEDQNRQIKILKIVMFADIFLFIVAIIVMAILQSNFRIDMMIPFLLATLAAAVTGGGAYLKFQSSRLQLRQADVNLNKAITLQNQTKAKYVNVTNAVDYACEKFHVNNSMELNYIWELYLEEVNERKAFEQTNEDLAYFNSRMIRELKSYHLYDAAVWNHQTRAIVNKKEMVEVKHQLLVRRQKLRSRIDEQVNLLQDSKKKMLLLLKDKNEYRQEIIDVIKTVDQMTGQ